MRQLRELPNSPDPWLVSLGDLLTLLLCFFLASFVSTPSSFVKISQLSQEVKGQAGEMPRSAASGTKSAEVFVLEERDFEHPNSILSLEAKKRLAPLLGSCSRAEFQALVCERRDRPVGVSIFDAAARIAEFLEGCGGALEIELIGARCELLATSAQNTQQTLSPLIVVEMRRRL